MNYNFRPAEEEDIDAVFELYEKRIAWMNEKGIRQWNVTDYLSVYPKPCYRTQQRLGNLYVMCSEVVVGAVVLLRSDDQWNNVSDTDALYVHNFVTDPKEKGAGKIMISESEKMCAAQGRRFIRLDCAADNLFLNNYYVSLGYELVGTCRDGFYIGNMREKKL